MNLSVMIKAIQELGYAPDDARARVCQDIVLKAISQSTLSGNVTIKGGEIKRVGKIEELSQQDYNGKRVYIHITDHKGNFIDSKIDLGVHKHLEIEQEEYCFDIAFDDKGVSLLANTREQMFAEKLRSLLKFGPFSTRYKDIYDMYYQCGRMDEGKLTQCLHTFIFDDSGMRENDMNAIVNRVEFVFTDKAYGQRVDASDKRWMDADIKDVFSGILDYLRMLK